MGRQKNRTKGFLSRLPNSELTQLKEANGALTTANKELSADLTTDQACIAELTAAAADAKKITAVPPASFGSNSTYGAN